METGLSGPDLSVTRPLLVASDGLILKCPNVWEFGEAVESSLIGPVRWHEESSKGWRSSTPPAPRGGAPPPLLHRGVARCLHPHLSHN